MKRFVPLLLIFASLLGPGALAESNHCVRHSCSSPGPR